MSEGAVRQWLKRAREAGADALAAHPPPGSPPKLTDEQRAKIPLLLAQRAEPYGFRGEVWTSKRVAVVIKRVFGVTYHPDHVRKLLRAAGWSPQPPKTQASQRNDESIAEWVEERWPLIKKKRTTNTAPSAL